ncbi:DUF2194 domain-containing protein [Paenibacillus arenilitoris]|uniref:DUF2194 domain-containing protein n=1 Tax=Paenibacillus arenilitoris TaxID=2772299 RepID=A0A927H4J3_9BACL|nr:DUF2194 domain-containing protein [Paenibacillus arenilitoris]MBD2867543.1 DUF2194 domain-containing protein [Paenibacillus arenilitoris]
MKPKLRLNRNVYLIVLSVVLLAIGVQITHSQFVLQFSHNEQMIEGVKQWKEAAAGSRAIEPSGPPYCLAYDGTDEFSVKVNEQAMRVLQYMKKPVKAIDLRQGMLAPSGCEAVLVSVHRLGLLGDAQTLADYVDRGGYAFLTMYPEQDDAFYRLYRKMGILDAGELVEAQGITLTSNVLIGENGLVIDDPFITNPVLSVALDEKSRVLATTAGGVPLLWDYPYGEGKFMVFNGTMLQEKINRGLIAGAVSMLMPEFIYPIFNAKIMYIDDFPAPIASTLDADLYRDYRRDRPAFFRDVWWPDMLKAAKQYDIVYTAVLIESYNDNTEPPFRSPVDADVKGLVSYGREVLKSGGEIGLHGYNHQSLVLSQAVAGEFGYNAWPGTEEMAESIEEVVRFAKTAFPNYTMLSYVPPSNVLSREGREALKQGWPDIAVISSLYAEDSSGLSYVQEFEIAEDGILELPRVTSGYMQGSFERWSEASTMTSLGIFSHFIHPDDLLNDQRSHGLDWEELYEKYTEMLARLDKTYPWLRPLTSTEAAIRTAETLSSGVTWARSGRTLHGSVEPYRSELHFIMRTERTIRAHAGCTVRKIDEGVYLITAGKAEFKIELGG